MEPNTVAVIPLTCPAPLPSGLGYVSALHGTSRAQASCYLHGMPEEDTQQSCVR